MSQPNIREVARIAVGIERYAERALTFAFEDDVVCVKAPVDDDYLAWLASLGSVPSPERIIVTDPTSAYPAESLLSRHIAADSALAARIAGLAGPAFSLDTYIFTQAEAELAGSLESTLGRVIPTMGGNAAAVADANQKHVVRSKAVELGIPVAPGRVVSLRTSELDALETAIDEFLPVTGRVIVRGAEGASGCSVFIVNRDVPESLRAVDRIRSRTDNRVYLVEVMIPVEASPNIGMIISPRDGGISCVSVTDQILEDGIYYLGNRYPSRAKHLDKMIDAARRLSEWLRSQGVTGHIGYDFCETADPSSELPEFFLCEINPRVNGATYSRAVKEKVGAGAYGSAFVRPAARSFSELRDKFGEHFFSREKGAGIVPINTGCLVYSRCAFVILGESMEQVRSVYSALPPEALGPAAPPDSAFE